MRAFNPKLELFFRRRRWGSGPEPGDAAGSEIVPLLEIGNRGGKYKNRGNKAKEYLRTKDFTFLNTAKYTRLARNFAQIEP